MISTLYQLKSKMPYDFDLVRHADERLCALAHFSVLKINDVVVYDRGYFSYKMLYEHTTSGIHAIFRLSKNSYSEIDEFIAQSVITDTVIVIEPTGSSHKNNVKKHPELKIIPLKFRLIKYNHGGTEYVLGTTLLCDSYTVDEFSDVYHSRWGIEELYKISKKHIEVDDFHGRSERKIRQELYAHFVMITISRLFSNQSDFEINNDSNPPTVNSKNQEDGLRPLRSLIKVNFKNCLLAVEFNIENLLLKKNINLETQIASTMKRTILVAQKARPNRSYPRISMKPDKRWRSIKFPNNKKETTEQYNVTAPPV